MYVIMYVLITIHCMVCVSTVLQVLEVRAVGFPFTDADDR